MREDEKIFIFSPHSFYMVYGGNVSAPISYGSCCGRNNPALPFVFSDQIFEKNLTVGFCENRVILKKGEKTGIKIWIENSSVFPVGRYRLEFTRAYKKNEKNFFL